MNEYDILLLFRKPMLSITKSMNQTNQMLKFSCCYSISSYILKDIDRQSFGSINLFNKNRTLSFHS